MAENSFVEEVTFNLSISVPYLSELINNNSVEKNMNLQQALFFLKKDQVYKTKKIINISYLIMVLIKMRLLIFLVLSRYRLACKYRIISQISIYNWMQNYISDISGIAFSYF